jgi:polyferredoxin
MGKPLREREQTGSTPTPTPTSTATSTSTSTSTATPTRWRNPWRPLPAVRWAVQGAYLAFLVLVGFEFARFFAQVSGGGEVLASRPPAVEGFLPIAALVGLRRFLATGAWDEVHPAGLTILLAAIGTGALARKAFCSWVCPVGTLSRALEWVGRRTLWRRRWPEVPRWLDLPLLCLKYLLLAFFVRTVFLGMPIDAIESFLHSPYNLAADAKMLLFFTDLSVTAAAVLAALALLSLVVKHFWCRYLCPYGALLGLASALSPQLVRRDPATCNDCRACSRACPVEIPVHRRLRVLTPECTGCMSCVAACTVPDCLTVTRKAARGWSPWLVPAAGLGIMLGAWTLARATGHWETAVPAGAFR